MGTALARATPLRPPLEPAETTPSAGSTFTIVGRRPTGGLRVLPSTRDNGPSREGGPSTREGGPSTREGGQSIREGGLSTRDGGRLAALRAAGLVRHATERTDTGVEGTLPVSPVLRPLLPGGSLRRGGTVAVASSGPWGTGATSLLFALLAEASAAGSWCAVVGLPRLGLVAAAEAGLAVERMALIPYPGPEWAGVIGALVDGVDIVVAATPVGVPAQLASRLAAKVRQRGGVLVPIGQWSGADVTLEVTHGSWRGLDQGRGRLTGREVEVVAHGRGAATRARRARLWLPGPRGTAVPLAPGVVPLTRPEDAGDHGLRNVS